MSDEREATAGVIAPPPMIYAGSLVLGVVLHILRPISFLPSQVARALGLFLILAGVVLGPAAYREMRRAGTNIDPDLPATALVMTGPFRWTRNPLYLSLTLVYAGITALVNALWLALLLPLVLVVMRRAVIDREERYLERRFGEEYRQYKERVRRWI